MKKLSVSVSAFIIVSIFAMPVHASSLAGNALLFDGENDFVRIPDAPHLDGMASLTIEAWFCPFGQSANPIVWKSDGGDRYTDRSYELQLPNGHNQAYMSFFTDTSGFTEVNKDEMQLISNQWVHVATTYDSINGVARLYLNGQLVVSEDMQAGGVLPISEAIRNTDQDLLLGAAFGTYLNGIFTHGLLDEVRIWDVARSDSQIDMFYNKTVIPSEVGLIGYWNFDEIFGSQIAIDSSIYGHNGVLGSSTTIDSADPMYILSTAPIVPEPATFLLLSLGGLVLRKRK